MQKSTAAPVVVRKVWRFNLADEFNLIQQCASQFKFISVDTEFPGTVFHLDAPPGKPFSSVSPVHHYAQMKRNVDALSLIQVGLTLSDSSGNLPRFGTAFQHVWEFNFRDFDVNRHLCNQDSISLLRSQGIDFSKNNRDGIDSRDFAAFFLNSWLGPRYAGRVWVTFHGLYDFGYLIKIMTRRPLPEDLGCFVALVRCVFGMHVYDLKPVSRVFGLKGGLEKVAESLGLGRAAGKSHQAGSDSLLTMHAFLQLVKKNFPLLLRCNYMLYGLTTCKC